MITASVPRVTKSETQTTDGTGETTSALSRQTGGNHYKNMLIQPAEYAEKNGLSLLEVEPNAVLLGGLMLVKTKTKKKKKTK